MSKPQKSFESYLLTTDNKTVSFNDYLKCPATAFLSYLIDAKDAINYCKNNFQKNQNGKLNKDAQDSYRHISCALLPAIMGHFETFQKALFAGMFERSRWVESFNTEAFFKALEDRCGKLTIDLIRVSAYRGLNASIGQLLADALYGWHSPEKVNLFFKAFDLKIDFYSKDDIEQLSILWQLRHSIVHTGGYITRPDSQKIRALVKYGDIPIVFKDNAIHEICRKLHPIINHSTLRLAKAFKSKLPTNKHADVDKFYTIKSKIMTWLR
jgi:hypothetical protein